jgi:putative transcriptional regulator
MPIVINLDVQLAKRKMKLTEVSNLVGISVQNLSVLKTGKAKAIRFSTLEKLCQALECTPGDLIEYRKSKQEAVTQS